jgi:tetratricopeptide (TPR) repeat protein
MLEHARLVLNMGRTERAFELVRQAIVSADAAGLEAMERAAARALCDVAVGAAHTAGEESLGTPTLRRVADELFSIGQYDEALDFYRQVIAGTPCSSEAFLEHRWHAWERIAASYKRLGDRLGEALAYEPIHEAWTRGVIPVKADEMSDPNLNRAGNNRRAAQVAFRQVAGDTGSPVFEREEQTIAESFRFAYPDHPSCMVSMDPLPHAWHEAIDLRRRGDDRWLLRMRQAYELSVRRTEDPVAAGKDRAWMYRIRVRRELGELNGALDEVRQAWAFWTSDRARTESARYGSVAHRRHQAMGSSLYWKARTLHELGRHEEAAATLDGWHAEYADLDSPYPELGYDLLVQAHLAAGQPDAADAAWRELLRRYPEYRRLGNVAFLLATHHHQRCDPLQASLRPTAAELSEARIRLREAKMEGLRLKSLLAWLDNRLREVEEINRSRRDLGLPEKHEEPRQLSRRIEETKGLLEAWSPRVAERRAEVRRLRAQLAGLEQQLYEPLSRAAGYYQAWDLAASASGAQDDPARIYALAEMRWRLAQIQPEVTAHWETARRQYERFLALLSVGLRSAGDPEVRTANERLGRIYVHLAQQR